MACCFGLRRGLDPAADPLYHRRCRCLSSARCVLWSCLCVCALVVIVVGLVSVYLIVRVRWLDWSNSGVHTQLGRLHTEGGCPPNWALSIHPILHLGTQLGARWRTASRAFVLRNRQVFEFGSVLYVFVAFYHRRLYNHSYTCIGKSGLWPALCQLSSGSHVVFYAKRTWNIAWWYQSFSFVQLHKLGRVQLSKIPLYTVVHGEDDVGNDCPVHNDCFRVLTTFRNPKF